MEGAKLLESLQNGNFKKVDERIQVWTVQLNI